MATQSHYNSEEQQAIVDSMRKSASNFGHIDGVKVQYGARELTLIVDDDVSLTALDMQDMMLNNDGVVMKKSGKAPGHARYMTFKPDA